MNIFRFFNRMLLPCMPFPYPEHNSSLSKKMQREKLILKRHFVVCTSISDTYMVATKLGSVAMDILTFCLSAFGQVFDSSLISEDELFARPNMIDAN